MGRTPILALLALQAALASAAPAAELGLWPKPQRLVRLESISHPYGGMGSKGGQSNATAGP